MTGLTYTSISSLSSTIRPFASRITGRDMDTFPVREISIDAKDKVPFSLLFAVVVTISLSCCVKAGFSIQKAAVADRKKADAAQPAIHFFFTPSLPHVHIKNKSV